MTFRGWLVAMFLMVALVSCGTATPSTRTPEQWKADVLEIATLVGDVVVQTKGTAWVLREAPELLPILDTSGDKVLQLAEVAGAPPALFDRQAVARLIVAATAEYLRRN